MKVFCNELRAKIYARIIQKTFRRTRPGGDATPPGVFPPGALTPGQFPKSKKQPMDLAVDTVDVHFFRANTGGHGF